MSVCCDLVLIILGIVFMTSFGDSDLDCESQIKTWILGFIIIEGISMLRKIITLSINGFTSDPVKNK